jgi:hypothetical protein
MNKLTKVLFVVVGLMVVFALAVPLQAGPPPKYLHAKGGLIDLAHPEGTDWHELYPVFCTNYTLDKWLDNGDGVLSPCDEIIIHQKPDGPVKSYHVENVTITLLVTPVENHMVDENGLPPLESPPQGAGKSMYIELEGGYKASVLTNPVCSQWHEIYPDFCTQYHLSAWNDTDEVGKLDFCDRICLTPKDWPPICPLDEDFSSGCFPPIGWTTDDWAESNTSNAGGTPPEADLGWYAIDGDYSYLDSKPVDTTGAPSLTLEFKSFIDDDPGCLFYYRCEVYIRAHGGDSWTDVTPWSNPITSDVGPGNYTVDISSDIGTGTQVRFQFTGNPCGIWDWWVDDVRICRPTGPWWHVEEVATDIVVTPGPPPPVGGEAYPVEKASLLSPWIAVAVILAGGISWYVLKRRKAQG